MAKKTSEDKIIQLAISKRIKLLCKEKGISSDKVSDNTSEHLDVNNKENDKIQFVGKDTFDSYRYNKSMPPVSTLFNLARFFKCDVDYLLGILPEDQKTHSVKDLHTFSNMDNESCDIFLSKTEDPNTKKCFEWMLKNGLFDLLIDLNNLSRRIAEKEYYYNHIPLQLQKIINTALSLHPVNNRLSDDGEKKLAEWISKLSNDDLETYNKMFAMLGINAGMYDEIDGEQRFSPATDYDIDALPNIESLDDLDDADREKLKELHIKMMLNKEYDLQVDLYENCCVFANTYLQTEQIKKIDLFWLTDKFTNLLSEYLKQSFSFNKYVVDKFASQALKEANSKIKGDDK